MTVLGSIQLNRVFAEKFHGLIWRLQIHEETGYLAIENRDIETKKVSFSILNLNKGEFHFKERVYAEPMNANLAYLSANSLLLKLNESIESPESSGLISIDINSGKILWEKYNVGIQQATDYGLQIFDIKIHPRRYYWINHLDATIIPEPNPNIQHNSSLIFPEINNQFIIPNFIEHTIIEGGVSVLKISELEIICFHEKINHALQQRLIVYQGDKILHEDILISNIQKLQPESFFILNKQLIYIRNKDEIVSYFV